MTEGDFPYRQAAEYVVLELLRGQWTIALLSALAPGEVRRNSLEEKINTVDERAGRRIHEAPINDRTLENTLRRAEKDGLIEKRKEPVSKGEPFGATFYTLTPKGLSLLTTLRPVAEWGKKHSPARAAEPGEASAS